MYKLARALTVSFLTIAGQKISPTRDEVATDVLDQNSNTITRSVSTLFQVGKERGIIDAG
jgi:hypothetical protein